MVRLDSSPPRSSISWFAASPNPSTIFGGTEVGVCGWPSAVQVFVLPTECSGVLVHPRVVVLTDLCPEYSPGEEVQFRFHDQFGVGVDVVAEACQFDADGVGFCTLADELAIPYAPILSGCERAELDVGTPLTLVGYGRRTEDTYDYSKNYGEVTVDYIGLGSFIVEGDQAPCVGDDGTPAFLQLADGTWRVAGVARDGDCSNPTTILDLGARIEWLETESGFDLTPCHDAEGLPDPSPACGGFYAGGSGGQGDWADLCAAATDRGSRATVCVRGRSPAR